MSAYKIGEYDLMRIGANGCGSINCSVEGYWSRDPLTLYINRGWATSIEEGVWTVSMSHSSGGRDTKVLEDDMQATCNFAEGMTALANLGREIREMQVQLEAFYQAQRELNRQEREAEKKAQAEREAADQPLGRLQAERLMLDAEIYHQHITYFLRGSDQPRTIELQQRVKTKWYMNGTNASKKAVVEFLATCSERSKLAE
jgi:hypothetical protein